MNLLALFTTGEDVWVKTGIDMETTTFVEGEIVEVQANELAVKINSDTLLTIILEDVKERVFKKLSLINLYVKGFLEYEEGASEYQLSKKQLLQEVKEEMLSLQYCDSCQSNEGIEEELNIKDLEYLGTVYEFFGEVDNYKLEGVFRLNGQYYVTYDAGNGHCHIGIMDQEMTKIMKMKFTAEFQEEETK
jgi:hypothetical protein